MIRLACWGAVDVECNQRRLDSGVTAPDSRAGVGCYRSQRPFFFIHVIIRASSDTSGHTCTKEIAEHGRIELGDMLVSPPKAVYKDAGSAKIGPYSVGVVRLFMAN